MLRHNKDWRKEEAWTLAKRSVLLIFAAIFLVGGCDVLGRNDKERTEVEKENIQTAAWQDEFTREFLISSEETEEGYYTFKSGTGGYTMLYPVNAVMDDIYYQRSENYYEEIYFGESRKDENYTYALTGHFEDRGITEWINENLELLSETPITTEDFKKYTIDDNDIYFAEYKLTANDNENGYYLVFLCYVKSRSNHKAIHFRFSSTCLSETEECKLEVNEERERARKIFHSVHFNS